MHDQIFDLTPGFIVVTFPFAKGYSLPNGNEVGNEKGNDNSVLILNSISANSQITLDMIVEQTGLAKRTVSRETKAMQESGILKRIGSARAGYWEIVKK